MNIRDPTPDDEVWMLETLDALGMRDIGFRSYHYIVVTTDSGERVGLGRLTKHDDDTVELTHIGAIGGRKAAVKAYVARGLVKRALDDGYETVLVTADSTRPFEAVGFEAADSEHECVVTASESETVLRWVPPSEREDDQETQSPDKTTTENRDGPSYKYDPNAPSTANTEEESPPQSAQTDSTEVAAHRQGINPESVNSKYDTDQDGKSKRTKYKG